MGTLSLFPLPLFVLPRHYQSRTQTHITHSFFRPHISSVNLKSTRFPDNTIAFSINSNDPKDSKFLDENGAIDDMDGYLNQLSLEYDSVWDTKPSWCQPWTIMLTGVSIVACSWLILHSVPVTSVVLLLICTWWYIFLYSYPKAYSEMIAERRERVVTGAEDTYGQSKRQ
ncbi:Spindle pole body-associated protein [Quillaja saponaria]|uniref:Spindle pole body-associated protein n=1 Tax=Quillaja saponaria TaxID=32244 RepID=A0AAD7VIW3_QUISA|nr:Spindle pole body-associated protein [Quillaja saponaria]